MNMEVFLGQRVFFTTREFALAVGRSIDSASRTLNRLADEGVLVRVTRGVWANPRHPYFSPYGAVPYLLGNEQGYVSFLSALHRHGVISQIPTAIQIATTGHGRTVKSPIGVFEFFQMRPEMMQSGVEVFEGAGVTYNLATAEKALLDTFYLSTRRGKRFGRLPELELSEIDAQQFLLLSKSQIRSPRISSAVLKAWRRKSIDPAFP